MSKEGLSWLLVDGIHYILEKLVKSKAMIKKKAM
jgi:hypothetical protein